MSQQEFCEQCGKPIPEREIAYCKKCSATLHPQCKCDCEKESDNE